MINIKKQLPDSFDVRRYLWLIVFIATVGISSTFTNITYALGEVIADIIRDGLILTGIIGLITAPFRKKEWEWFHWLNLLMYTTASAKILYPNLIDNPYSAFIVTILVFISIIFIPNFKDLYGTESKSRSNSSINKSKSETTLNKTQRKFVVQDVKKEVAGKRSRVQDDYEDTQTKSTEKDDYIVKIKEAKSLLDKSIISEEQFEKIKQKIINKI